MADWPPVDGEDVDWNALREKDPDELLEMGCRWWSRKNRLMLLPHAWRNDIPDDFEVVSIDRTRYKWWEVDTCDQRFGMLAYGILVGDG